MIKTFGEWEEQEALYLALPHKNTDWKPYLNEILNSYKELILQASKYQKCILICPDNEILEQFKNINNCELIKLETNDTWIRDYGIINIKNKNEIINYNFKFNAWGQKYESDLDDSLNEKLAQKLNLKLTNIDFILEGGSIDFNSKGILLSTEKCILNKNRNSNLSSDEILEKIKNLFNLEKIILLKHGFIKGDDTDCHIDTLARFISPNCIAYASCNDKNDEHFLELNLMKEELQKSGFELLDLPIPSPKFYNGKRLACTYTNFIFINNALLVPIYNDKNDKIVLSKLEQKLPNHKIIGINSLVFVRQNGALHCASANKFKG